MSEPKDCFYTSHGLRLHYADWGNDSAPPLLLIHGGGDHCRSWDRLARELRPHFHVVAPDLRGHGDSGWTKGKVQVVGMNSVKRPGAKAGVQVVMATGNAA